MAKRVAVSTLNASTLDIINTIRANASAEYQSLVPEITDVHDIPKVGEVLFGYPALGNQFLNALINRIALVRVKSAVFNNAYAELKKGYLEFGETVEEVFVNIAKAREFSVDKAPAREFKRTVPDVRSAFHTMNYRVQYPVTIQNEELRMAFLSANGVQDLIARIVDTLYTAAEYDEYLLFKYLIIKAVAHGKMYPVSVGATLNTAAVQYRGISNKLGFMSKDYNAAGVTTTTPKADQYIFMDAIYNANYDVNLLSAAFNMDKAEFMGKLKLIDDFTTFDNDRFSEIRANSDGLEEVTADELALMAGVKAVLVDGEWFQMYDNLAQFTETYVASGMYWNYFYNVWKTVSSSPFSNAIVFVEGTPATPASVQFKIASIDKSANAVVFTLEQTETTSTNSSNAVFVQTEAATQAGIAIHKYGAVIMPRGTGTTATVTLAAKIGNTGYTASAALNRDTATVGTTITFNKNT